MISDIVIGGGTMPVLRKRTNPFWGRPAEEKHALSAHLRQGSGGGSGNTDRLLAKLQTDVTDIISIIKSNEVQMVDVGDAKVGVLRLARQQAGDSDAPMPLSVGALADQLSTTLRTQLRELTTVIKAQMSEKKTGNVGGGGGGVSTNDLKLIQSDLKAIKASVADSDGKATTDRLVDAPERAPIPGPVPLALSGAFVRTLVERVCTEREAQESDLLIEDGPDLLEYALHAGVSRARSNVKGVSQRRAPLDN